MKYLWLSFSGNSWSKGKNYQCRMDTCWHYLNYIPGRQKHDDYTFIISASLLILLITETDTVYCIYSLLNDCVLWLIFISDLCGIKNKTLGDVLLVITNDRLETLLQEVYDFHFCFFYFLFSITTHPEVTLFPFCHRDLSMRIFFLFIINEWHHSFQLFIVTVKTVIN